MWSGSSLQVCSPTFVTDRSDWTGGVDRASFFMLKVLGSNPTPSLPIPPLLYAESIKLPVRLSELLTTGIVLEG